MTQSAEAALGLASDQCTLNVIRDASYKYVHFTALPPANDYQSLCTTSEPGAPCTGAFQTST